LKRRISAALGPQSINTKLSSERWGALFLLAALGQKLTAGLLAKREESESWAAELRRRPEFVQENGAKFCAEAARLGLEELPQYWCRLSRARIDSLPV